MFFKVSSLALYASIVGHHLTYLWGYHASWIVKKLISINVRVTYTSYFVFTNNES